MIKLYRFLILLLIPTTAFGFQEYKGWADHFFKPNPGESDELFPLAPAPISSELRRRISGAVTLPDIFKTVRVIPLEITQATVLDQVRKVLFLDDSWIVLSNKGEVYRFSNEGTFISRIGAKGQGPGEYGYAFQIRIIPEKNLALLDKFTGRILIYNSQGQYLRQLNFRFDAGRITPGDDFIWTNNSLYLASPGSLGRPPPYGILNFVDGKLQPSYAFGEHVIPFHKTPEKERIFEFVHEGFEMVAGRLWTASPYDIDIQVFDHRGRWLAELPKRRPEALHREDFEDIDFLARGAGKVYKAMMRKSRNTWLVTCGRFVLAGLTAGNKGRTWHLYDDHGNLLKGDLAGGMPFLFLVGSRGDQIIGSHGPDYMSQMFPDMPERVQEVYLDAGYNPEKPHDNPVLVVGSLD